MNRFAETLKQAHSRLLIAEPGRTRVLLEMASDLEDSFQFYRNQGLGEAEAARRAEEAFGSSEETLSLLSKIHETGMGGIADRVSEQVGGLGARILLLLILVFEVWLAGVVLTAEAFRVYVSPFIWPVIGLAVVAFAFSVWKIGQVFSGVGRDVRRLRSGLGVLLFCAGASLAVAGCGFLFHLQRFFRLNFETAPESLFTNFAGWMIKISSMMTISLLVAIVTALVWFVLSNVVARAETREVEALLEAAG